MHSTRRLVLLISNIVSCRWYLIYTIFERVIGSAYKNIGQSGELLVRVGDDVANVVPKANS